MMRMSGVFYVAGALATAACASSSSRVLVDPHLTKEAEKLSAAKEKGREFEIRVSDGERTWTVVVPNGVDGYEMAIPLKGDLEKKKGREASKTRAGATAAATTPDVEMSAYLRGVARIRELRDAQNLELALLEAMKLTRNHPRRPRVWAMLGTLHAELGHKGDARTAWRRAIELDPKDNVTSDALDKLEKE